MKNNYSKKTLKTWTLLIYANGNNDLEPEISKSLLDIEKAGSDSNINIIVQLARAPYNLIENMRPHNLGPTNIDGDWIGARRYLVKDDQNLSETKYYKSELLEDLGNVNMADPITLKEFICFGIKKFPAKHFMLILAGHGAGFMGILPDYTLKSPQIMSLNGANIAINRAIEESGKKIDILLFDSCYMNMIESIYEFGIDSKSPTYLITPQASPIEGLPYEVIINVLKRMNKKNNTITLIKDLVTEVDKILNRNGTNLLVFSLNKAILRLIKIIINKISAFVIKNKIDLKKYSTSINGEYPSIDFYSLIEILRNITKNPIILINTFLLKISTNFIFLNSNENKSKSPDTKSLSIFTPTTDYFKLIEIYYSKIRFIQNNKWIQYLSDKNEDYEFNNQPFRYAIPPPDDMPLEGLINVIMSHNPELSLQDLNKTIKDLGWSNCIKLK